MTDAALGIDLGLTGVRVALVDRDGAVVARRRATHDGRGAGPADPDAWTREIATVVRSVMEAASAAQVVAIGVAAAGCQPIAVDEMLRPLTPAALTAIDPRPAAQRKRLAAEHGVSAGSMLDHALPTVLWWKEHDPSTFRRAAHALDGTGFVVAWLTSRPTMDRITREDYVLSGVEPPLPLPAPQEPLAVAGTVTGPAAAALGVEPGIPVTVGTYDSYVDLHSLSDAGARILLGSTMVLAVDAPPADDIRLAGLSTVVMPSGMPALSGWTSAAGATLAWAESRFGTIPGDLLPGAGGLVALPYLRGERTPVWDPEARGAVVGITGDTSAAELARSFLDAVCLSARDIVERMRNLGEVPARWRVGGGGVRSPAWLQATSDALAADLDVVDIADGVGAAVFALRGLGLDPDVPTIRTITPDAQRARRFDSLYPIYRSLYEPISGAMHALGALEERFTTDSPARP